jgi:hypothetical protein
MPHDKYGFNAQFWELDPSTRQSVHLFTKWAPVNVTLSSSNTAENFFTAASHQPTVNLVTNPSMETADPPTGYTAVGATIARSATVARSVTNSLSIDPDNSAAGEGAYWTTESIGSVRLDGSSALYLVASAYFQDNADSGNTARLEIRDSSGTLLSAGNELTLSSSWQRSQASYQVPPSGAQYRIYLVTSSSASDPIFYVDDLQVELQMNTTPTAYCDGTQGVYYEWDGTAHASVSRRRFGLVSVRSYDLYVTHDSYVALDHTASSTLGMYVPAGTHFSPPGGIVASNLSFINVVSGETPTIRGGIWGVHQGTRP